MVLFKNLAIVKILYRKSLELSCLHIEFGGCTPHAHHIGINRYRGDTAIALIAIVIERNHFESAAILVSLNDVKHKSTPSTEAFMLPLNEGTRRVSVGANIESHEVLIVNTTLES